MAVWAHRQAGDEVQGGDIIGTVQETAVVQHRVLWFPGVVGTLKEITAGEYTVEDTVAVVVTDQAARCR